MQLHVDKLTPHVTDAEEQRFASDWAYAYRCYAAGELKGYRGQFVGIFQEQIVGAGESEEGLRLSFADSYLESLDQLVVLLVDHNDVR